MSLILSMMLLHGLAVLTPGIDVVLISKTAMREGKKSAIFTAIGISVGCSIWIILTLAGFNILLTKFTWLQPIMMLLGGLFLAKMGWAMFGAYLNRHQMTILEETELKALPSFKQSFLTGLWTNLANPKALIYFTSVFSLAIQSPQLKELSILLGIFLVIETFILFACLGWALSHQQIKIYYQKNEIYIEAIAGLLFLGFAVFLIFDAIKGLLA